MDWLGIRTRSQASNNPVDEESMREFAEAVLPKREYNKLRTHISEPDLTEDQETQSPQAATQSPVSTSALNSASILDVPHFDNPRAQFAGQSLELTELEKAYEKGWANWQAEMDRGSLRWDLDQIRRNALAERGQTERNIAAAKAAGSYRSYKDYTSIPEPKRVKKSTPKRQRSTSSDEPTCTPEPKRAKKSTPNHRHSASGDVSRMSGGLVERNAPATSSPSSGAHPRATTTVGKALKGLETDLGSKWEIKPESRRLQGSPSTSHNQ